MDSTWTWAGFSNHLAVSSLLKAAIGYLAAFQASSVIVDSQVPVVDGIIGGVPLPPSIATTKSTDQLLSLTSLVTTPGKLRVVENSGICETTPGVYQASGYGDLTSTESIWFWFFAARTANPDSQPLSIWLNGGPGSSSMIGLFQENGPCRITNDSSGVTLNPTSWNEVSNMLFIDQPVGVGFSHGTTTVGTSLEAASDMWKFLQIFFADTRFSKYAKNEFAIWTESYGGHYGPTFAAYFLQQNAAIASGNISGLAINLKVLGVGNGLTDPLNQYPGYISYAAKNEYHPLVSPAVIKQANTSFFESGGCKDKITSCYNGGSTFVCSNAQDFCNINILSPLAGNWDVYYVPSPNPDPYPPSLTPYLTFSNVTSKIGAESLWQQTNFDVYSNFAQTGDWMSNSRLDLQTVINAGVRTIIYDGDADYIVNYKGVEAMVDALQTKFTGEYHAKSFSNFSVAGQVAGMYKNAGTFSYVRIFGAGHEVPAYKFGTLKRGQAALQMFSQSMANQSLTPT